MKHRQQAKGKGVKRKNQPQPQQIGFLENDSDESSENIIEDDESIDEDEAFTEEDYVKYGDIGMKRKRKDFSEEEEEDEEGGEYVNLSDLINSNSKQSKENEEEYNFEDSSEDSDDPEKHKRLLESVTKGKQAGPAAKKFKKEESEYYQESEFNLKPVGNKLGLADLMPSLEDTQNYGELKKKLEKLSEKQKDIHKPLSTATKERLVRVAAYQQAKKDITRWEQTVRTNRIVDQLRFPMNEPAPVPVSNKHLASTFKPVSEFEKQINEVIDEDGISEKNLIEAEELAFNELTEEEVKQRMGELAKMKYLMLYREKKFKQQKKIKSKSFRRMMRRTKEKQKLTLDELAEVDPEQYEKVLEQKELDRIRERMTLKHSTSSKWAKRVAKMKDLNSKQAIQEQLQKKAELRKKMQTMDSDSSEEDDEEEFNQMLNEVQEDKKQKGIAGMAFMKRAALKMKQEQLERLQEAEDEDKETEDPIVGRRKFVPASADALTDKPEKQTNAPASKKKPKKSPLTNISLSKLEKPGEKVDIGNKKKVNNETGGQTEYEDEEENDLANPWLKNSSAKIKKRKPIVEQNEDELNSKKKKQTTIEELDIEDVLSVPEHIINSNSLLSNQKTVVEEAFAGVDVFEEFKKEKTEEIDEATAVEEKTLPGWGTWAGVGVKLSKTQIRRSKLEKEKKEKEKLEKKKKRKDFKLSNVIINEKRDKKAAKFRVTQLPNEFSTQQQYERAISHPLGPDWNTLSSHKQITQPRIVTKSGLVIEPLTAPKIKQRKNPPRNLVRA